jgi:hypothetical protein
MGNPIFAGILSLIIPGLGHALINKKLKKGVVMFIIAIVAVALSIFTFGLTSLIWCLFSAYDAYMEADGKPVWKFE